MPKSLFAIPALCAAAILAAASSQAQSVVVNEYANQSPSVDTIELLVIQNNLDMQGMILKDYSTSMANDGGGARTFATNALWSSVSAGTIIVLTVDASTTDVDATDHVLRVGLNDATYFSSGTGTMDIATTDMIQIKAAGSGQPGSTGVIHTLASGVAGAQFTSSPTPKLIATGTTGAPNAVAANNSTSTLADYNGTDATGALPVVSQTFGAANNATNQAYINSLIGAPTSDALGWSMYE